MSTTQKTGIAFVALIAVAFVFATSFAFAQTAVEAELEAELNAISSQIDESTSIDVNVQALGTEADVSAQTGITTDADMEYDALFGADIAAMEGDMQADESMEVTAGTEGGFGASVSAFFDALVEFFFGWW